MLMGIGSALPLYGAVQQQQNTTPAAGAFSVAYSGDAQASAATQAPATAQAAQEGAMATGNQQAQDGSRIAEERATANLMNDRFMQQCQTCKNRKYQDGSNDPGVSFKSPQHIDPGMSASVVMGHEQEHVAHEQARADQEGGEVVSQSVVLHGDICPECGRYYIAGGTTTTKTRSGGEQAPAFHAEEGVGNLLDSIA